MDQNPPGIRLKEKIQLRQGRKPAKVAPPQWSSDILASSYRRQLERHNSAPVTSVSSFMALVAAINPPFKPITLHRPWSISAGTGATGSVEVHRYVPGRNFNLFNDTSSLKLHAYEPDARRTGDYYAIKRLKRACDGNFKTLATATADQFDKLATELRILAHSDLRGHPNLVYLFGVAHSPGQDQSSLSDPCLVLQEGDCGDLLTFCRAPVLSSNLHALVEVKMSLCFDIACGLEALHKHGVVHGDLKPQNVLVRRRDGRNTKMDRTTNAFEAGQVAIQAITGQSPFVAMLADFGGSIIFSDTVEKSMKKGMYTPLWCAPEFYADRLLSKKMLPRADIYSAGLVFAFILMEGRDIFTTVVHHGVLHSEDTTLSPDEVKQLKVSDRVLKLAQDEVAKFETSFFGITADGERIYISRDTMYSPPQLVIFNTIFTTCLSSDPSERVEKASDMLKAWGAALKLNFHTRFHMDYQSPQLFNLYNRGQLGRKDYFDHTKTCVRCTGKCQPVPAAFVDSQGCTSPGIFDIQQSFSIFRASLTSGLKSEIYNDLKSRVTLVQTIQHLSRRTITFESALSTTDLLKAAECAYQIGVAHLEGFGTAPSHLEALKWINTAVEWGSEKAMAAYLPFLISTGSWPQYEVVESRKLAICDSAKKAIIQGGHANTATALANVSPSSYTAALNGYRNHRADGVWKDFKNYSEFSQDILENAQHQIKDYFSRFTIDFTFPVGSGWTILHYAAYSGNLSTIKRLIQFWGADVRTLSLHGETALDVALEAGHQDVIDYLLSQHEEHQLPFFQRSCPLQNCAFLPQDQISDFVLRILRMERSSDVDLRNMAGRTALMNTLLLEAPLEASAKNKAIKLLLVAGANPLLTTPEPGTGSPLLFAVLQLRYDYVKSMLNAIKKFKHSVPHIYSSRARPEPANELARSYFYLMQKGSRTSRLSSGVGNYTTIYSKLITILTTDEVGNEIPYASKATTHNPLSLACYYGNAEAARIIVENRVKAGLPMKHYIEGEGAMQALHVAIDCGFSDVLDVFFPLMMERDDIATWNVLSSAIHHQPALVEKIFSFYEEKGRGQKVLEYVDPWGASALDTALEYGYLDLAKFLLEKGATYDDYRLKGDHSVDEGKQSTLASAIPHMKRIKFLMELTPAPRLIVTETGLNVFHILAADETLIGVTVGSTEFDDVLKYFYGLDKALITAKGGSYDMTPFHVVSLHYSKVVGAFLHTNGANINALDKSGYTPLDYLEFHAKGNEAPSDQRLTIDYTSGNPEVGHSICDYALAGPVYWYKESNLLSDMKAQYKKWGAKTGKEVKEANAERLRTLRLAARFGRGMEISGVPAVGETSRSRLLAERSRPPHRRRFDPNDPRAAYTPFAEFLNKESLAKK